ncbi:MAG: GTPase ObgE [Myxococcota bacterium]
MRFVDEATIEVEAGHGGPGAVTFRRESKVAFGGPDGGDGGRGADVIVASNTRITTLLDHRYKRWYRAPAGDPGDRGQRTGKGGEDLVIVLPVGTVVTDAETGEVIADLTDPDARVVVAEGGRGGRGNTFFATSTRQAPRHAQPGEEGAKRTLNLSLKLMADIGLLGLPNAGKSTFIRSVTRSRAKVGGYPFTTLVPNLGVAMLGDREVVIADIPGLVEGAHKGQGLGDRFLKHVERTRVLIHLLSLGPDAPDPLEAFDTINGELSAYSPTLQQLPQVVVLNKTDLLDDTYELTLWREAFAERGIIPLDGSGLTGSNVREIVAAAVRILDDSSAEEDQGGTDTSEPWSPI